MHRVLEQIAQRIQEQGGRAFLVGGAVRDLFFDKESKDLDVEVFGLTHDQVVAILRPFGRVDTVGKSFGVTKLTTPQGDDFDFSLPRRESKCGVGHKDFDVTVDHTLTPREAARRRDFTWNAMSQDLRTGEVLDFFGGVQDAQEHKLRVTDPETFVDDPDRVMRGFRFCGQEDLTATWETVQVCKSMRDEFKHLPKERVWAEWFKWASRSVKPSKGLEFLAQTRWLEHFPELQVLDFFPQDPEWHPEGNVWVHTLQAVDWAAQFKDPVVTMAALLHDTGKAFTTKVHPDGRVTSEGHAEQGAEQASRFLNRLGAPQAFTRQVVTLVRTHMRHLQGASKRTVRRLAVELAKGGVSFSQWAQVVESDHSARMGESAAQPQGRPEVVEKFLQLAADLAVEQSAPKPLVQGRDVLNFMSPGPRMGEALRAAFEAQLDGEFDTTETGVQWVREWVGQ